MGSDKRCHILSCFNTSRKLKFFSCSSSDRKPKCVQRITKALALLFQYFWRGLQLFPFVTGSTQSYKITLLDSVRLFQFYWKYWLGAWNAKGETVSCFGGGEIVHIFLFAKQTLYIVCSKHFRFHSYEISARIVRLCIKVVSLKKNGQGEFWNVNHIQGTSWTKHLAQIPQKITIQNWNGHLHCI